MNPAEDANAGILGQLAARAREAVSASDKFRISLSELVQRVDSSRPELLRACDELNSRFIARRKWEKKAGIGVCQMSDANTEFAAWGRRIYKPTPSSLSLADQKEAIYHAKTMQEMAYQIELDAKAGIRGCGPWLRQLKEALAGFERVA